MKIEYEKIEEILKKLIEEWGKNSLLEINKGIALLQDYFPNMENERNLLIEILKTGVWKSLLELKFKNRQEQEAGIEECKKIF